MKADQAEQRRFASALSVLMEVEFFLYSVAPTVSASYRLCTSMLLAIRFAREFLGPHFPTLAQRTYDLILAHLTRGENDDDVDIEAFLSLETLNLLLAARELGPDYLLPASLINRIFEREESLSYFQIMCCLWYTQQEAEYGPLRQKIVQAAKSILGNLDQITSDSEQAYLILDLLACPFVPEDDKRDLIQKAATALQFGTPAKAEVDALLAHDGHWHVDWSGVDLLNLLERKELKQVY